MTHRLRQALLVLVLVAAFALGGAAVSGAVGGGGGSTAATTTQERDDESGPPRRSDETALSGDTAERVRAAALAEFEGATVERVETDGDGNAAYEAHLVTADGTPVTVYVNREFEVVRSEEGRPGGGPRGCRPPPDRGSDDDAAS